MGLPDTLARPRRLFPKGGARRVKNAGSEGLTHHQCLKLVDAVERAARLGKPLNRTVDISWSLAGVDEFAATDMTGEFLKLAADWMRPRDGKLCWIYVHEHGPVFKAHVHLLMHVPLRLEKAFATASRRWLKKLIGGAYQRGALRSRRIRGAGAPDAVSADLYRHGLMQRLRYMLKAARRDLEDVLGMVGHGTARWGQTSRVYGRRAGWWQKRASRG